MGKIRNDTGIRNAVASVATGDLEDSVGWYERLLGHAPDSRLAEAAAEWKLPEGGWLQLYVDPERAGSSSVTLTTADLDASLRRLRTMGIRPEATSLTDVVDVAVVSDPDGNRIVLAETFAGHAFRGPPR